MRMRYGRYGASAIIIEPWFMFHTPEQVPSSVFIVCFANSPSYQLCALIGQRPVCRSQISGSIRLGVVAAIVLLARDQGAVSLTKWGNG